MHPDAPRFPLPSEPESPIDPLELVEPSTPEQEAYVDRFLRDQREDDARVRTEPWCEATGGW